MPYPPRTIVFDLPSGSQEKPKRGAQSPLSAPKSCWFPAPGTATGSQVTIVEAEEQTGAERDHMPVPGPNHVVDGFERAVVIPVGVKCGAARQNGAVLFRYQRGNVGVSAIPPKIVVAVADLK